MGSKAGWAPKAKHRVEGGGSRNVSNYLIYGCIVFVPYVLVKKLLGVSWWYYVVSMAILALPIVGLVLYTYSMFYSSNTNPAVKQSGKPLDSYITIKDPKIKEKYRNNKIPMEVFFEAYFDELIDLAKDDDGSEKDLFELLEDRYDWVTFQFTWNQIKFFLFTWIPELIFHTAKQDESQICGNYDRGDDFYQAFLGESMVYTCGLLTQCDEDDKVDTLEEMQENKMKLVCERLRLKPSDKLLDIGCGWGGFVNYVAEKYGVNATGITLSRNQVEWGNRVASEKGLADRVRIIRQDYRDMPNRPQEYQTITAFEMAEHVGIRRFQSFLRQVCELLDDNGTFYMQVSGLRRSWTFEDLVWGLFMAKYVFPGADASTPLYWYVNQLETAGFEVHKVDTVGIHYAATLWRWYHNWLSNREKVIGKYGVRWFRIWQVFLAWSAIAARQGSATCYQIVAHKNLSSFDRTALFSVQKQ